MSGVWLWVGMGMLYFASAGVGIVLGGILIRMFYGISRWVGGRMKARDHSES